MGLTQFPPADTAATAAIHLSNVTYFFGIATKIQVGVPWGVTANLVVRRGQDGIAFNPAFPKTGGGEDIDFCLRKWKANVKEGGEALYAAPRVVVTHPWWNGGRRSHRRFYYWAKGDGALMKLWPEHTFYGVAPNSGELFILCCIGIAASVLLGSWRYFSASLKITASVIAGNIAHDAYRHWRTWTCGGFESSKYVISGPRWAIAVVEGSVIRMTSEVGRVVCVLERREFEQLGKRFDWWAGTSGEGTMRDERRNTSETLLLVTLIWFILERLM